MLSAADIAHQLFHDSKVVRDHALRSLAMAGDRNEIGAEVPLGSLERFGANAFTHPMLITQLNVSPAVAQKAFGAAVGASLALRSVAGGVLRELPTSLLLANRDLIRGLAAGDLRTCLEHRLALSQQPHSNLWEQLLASADRADAHDLVLALVPHDAAIAPLLISTLVRNVSTRGELAAIELAGRIHLTAAVNALVDRLSRPEAEIVEAAAVALGRLGTAGAATILEQRCYLSSATASFRTGAARAMSHFRIPSVESTLLRLVVEEDDQDALCTLCSALTDICTTTGFSRLREIVASGRCGSQTAALQSSVSALDEMIKSTTARTAAAHHAPPRAAPTAPASSPATPAGGPLLSTLNAGRFSTADVTDQNLGPPSDELPLMEISDDVPPSASTPSAPSAAASPQLRRDASQVGRNDLCPCGSGKKYKKCCGA